MKTAIVYDRVNKWGGAERVLLALHEIFPNAPLYTSVYDSTKAVWANVFPYVHYSFLQHIPILKNHHELLGWLTPLAYESFTFDEYDLVISVTSEAAKGIITKPQTKHICICLTPTRYLWSGFNEYQINPPTKLGWIPFYQYVSKPFLYYAKVWDKVAAQRPDVYVAISSEVKRRIKKYYGRESHIIYPPVDVERFMVKDLRKNKKDYYLIVSRLVPYKKVDLAISAFNKLGKALVVVGIGSELGKLKALASENIVFKGFANEELLVKYYQNAKALIYPQEEDFGITAVEAQAAQVPVVAFKKGGVLDTIIDGKTGIFFENQTVESLMAGVVNFEKMRFDKNLLLRNSRKFTIENFKRNFLKLVEEVVSS